MSSPEEIMTVSEERMKKSMAQLQKEFHTVRTGRANPQILDRVEVEYYGTATSLKSLANITTPDGRSLVIQPYDKNILKDIEQAIHKSGLGLTANNDGTVVRINIPAPSEERRKEMVKLVKKFGEETRIALRNIRRDGADEIKKLKGNQISDDQVKRHEDNLQKLTDRYVKEVDKHIDDKEEEVMEV
jgi:ribosome recycling factor